MSLASTNADGKFTKGLLYDTRCCVTPGSTLVVDYELEDRRLLTSPDGAWTGLVLLKVEKPQSPPHSTLNPVTTTRQKHFEEATDINDTSTSEIDLLKNKKHQFGNVLQWDTIEIDLISDAFIFWHDSTNSMKRFHLLAEDVHFPNDEWFVLTFRIIPDTQIVFYINETKVNMRNPENKCPTMNTSPDHVTLGSSQFEGYVARFALYQRPLLDDEIKSIVWEFLHPRIVGMQLCRGHFYDNLRFLYSDCSSRSYGGRVNQYYFHPLLLEDDDDYVTFISILNLQSFHYKIQVRTRNGKKWISKLQRHKKQKVRDQVLQGERMFSCEEDQEIVDLRVEYESNNKYFGRWNATDIVTQDVCADTEKIQCRKQLREFYLEGLKVIQDETAATVNTGYELDKPKVCQWDYNAKMKWREYQWMVRAEPPRFLKTYLVDPGHLHVSPTSVVLSASYRYKRPLNINRDDANEQQLWEDRRVAIKFMSEFEVLEKEILRRSVLQSCSDHVVPIIAIALTFRPSFIKGAENAFENKIIKVHRDRDLYDKISSVLKHSSRINNRVLANQRVGVSHKARYKYCIVIELGERTLFEAIKHEHFAGKDWLLIRQIMNCVCEALYKIHFSQYIHGDVKPLNIVRVGERWKLIDMELSTKIGTSIGAKQPSNGYCPPEYASALLNSTLERGATTSRIQYEATVAHDLWSLGCVLYHLMYGRPLFTIDINDNLSREDLSKVCCWSETDCNRKLEEVEHDRQKKEFVTGKKLLRMLLHPSPTERMGLFTSGREMLDVLVKPFFLDEGLTQQDLIGLESRLSFRFDRIDNQLKVNFNLISLVLREVTSSVPSLILFLPNKTNRDRSILFTPEKWFNTTVILYFVDPISLRVAPTNDNNGFEIRFPQEWVNIALPWIRVSLKALKFAAIAGRLTGFPIPDVAADVLKYTDTLINHFSNIARELRTDLARLTKDEKQALKLVSEGETICGQYVDGMLENVAPLKGRSFDKKFNTMMKTVITEFLPLLPEKWIEKCGLTFVTSPKDGGTNWVLEQYVEYYKQYGEAALGTQSYRISSQVVTPQHATSTIAVVQPEVLPPDPLPVLEPAVVPTSQQYFDCHCGKAHCACGCRIS